MLTGKLAGTLPTTEDLRALHAGHLRPDATERVRVFTLHSPRLLAQYAALAGLTLAAARLALSSTKPHSIE